MENILSAPDMRSEFGQKISCLIKPAAKIFRQDAVLIDPVNGRPIEEAAPGDKKDNQQTSSSQYGKREKIPSFNMKLRGGVSMLHRYFPAFLPPGTGADIRGAAYYLVCLCSVTSRTPGLLQ